MTEKILVVEDEEDIRDAIRYSLQKQGYAVALATDGAEALRVARAERPDLILLDLLLPVMDGREVCRKLRRESATPIVMLTAKAEEVDRIVGLELGADDYIAKPFSMRELIARVRAAMRRVRLDRAAGVPCELVFGALRIDAVERRVSLGGQPVELTRKEFDLLLTLASQPNIVVRRDSLLRAVWGENFVGDPKTLDVHIRWLREKIERDPRRPRFVHTVRGIGYRFAEAVAVPGA